MKTEDRKASLAENSTPQPDLGTLQKSLYARPVLRVFGSVGKLTKGSAGTSIDGGNQGTAAPDNGPFTTSR